MSMGFVLGRPPQEGGNLLGGPTPLPVFGKEAQQGTSKPFWGQGGAKYPTPRGNASKTPSWPS